MRKSAKQRNLFDEELDINFFAGGGGASVGVEQANECPEYLAVNHDPEAIKMHQANHPNTIHACEDVFHINLRKYLKRGQRVRCFWASPDCTQFSRAKGGTPVKKRIRCLGWSIIRAIKSIKQITGHLPRKLVIENVREYEDWGPVIHATDAQGKKLYSAIQEPIWIPDKSKKGETFKRWLRELRKLGGQVEWRQLNAADYGAPTHRRRLFIIIRFDGKPIQWPKPTHGPGQANPYRAAGECLDYSLPCPSIFLTKAEATELRKRTGVACKRPLADKTMWRIANGTVRYVINSANPFIVQTGYGEREGQAARVNDAGDPIGTLVTKKKHALAAPIFTKFYSSGGQLSNPAEPGPTITAKDRLAVSPVFLVKTNHGNGDGAEPLRTHNPAGPLGSITSHNGTGVVSPILIQYNGEKEKETRSQPVSEPVNTVPTENRFALTTAFLQKICQNGSNGARNSDLVEPARTVCTKNEDSLVAASLIKMRGDSIGSAATDPAPTVTSGAGAKRPAGAAHAMGLMAAHLVGAGGSQYAAKPRPADKPINTIKPENRQALIAAMITQFYGGGENGNPAPGKSANDPLPSVTAIDHNGLVAAFLYKAYGTNIASSLMDSMPTVTGGGNHLWQVHAWLSAGCSEEAMAGFWRVYSFLCKHLGPEAPLPLVMLNGQLYLIVDIGMRMLTARELFRCQGFPEDYLLTGSQHSQVARCGNSVSPPVARAIIEANRDDQSIPEHQSRKAKIAA